MEAIKFKTNIKCAACVAKVTPVLNDATGADNWEVDLSNPERILTVVGAPNEAKIKDALQKVGYKAERL